MQSSSTPTPSPHGSGECYASATKRLRVLIADDEPLARDRVRAVLCDDPSLVIVAESTNGPETIGALERERPDVVLLDVQMPGCDGINVAANLPPAIQPAIIFVSAHDRFAVDAFAVRAVDYVLKPFDPERLHLALVRAREYLASRGDGLVRIETLIAKSGAPAARVTDRLALRTEGRIVFVRVDEIAWVEAANNYVIVHLDDQRRHVVHESLAVVEERLGAARFARVNRSAIVRVDAVQEVHRLPYGDYVVLLRDGTRLSMSRSLRGRWKKFLSSAA